MTWRHSVYRPTPEQAAEYNRRAAERKRRNRQEQRDALNAIPRATLGTSRRHRHGCAFAPCLSSAGPDELLCPSHAVSVPAADLALLHDLWHGGTVREYLALRERVMFDLHVRHGVRVVQASLEASRRRNDE